MTIALQIDNISVQFGGVCAVDRVSFAVQTGDLVGLIGPNGAGKTTLIRVVAGLLKPDRGRVVLNGNDITKYPTPKRVRKGLVLTHQIVRPFREMTVLENVALAAGYRKTLNPFRAITHLDRSQENESAATIITQVGLGGNERKLAGSLPLGQMKRLEVARALAVDPQVILLDEPLAGLNQTEASEQIETISKIHARGVTVILVEHNLEEVLRACRRLIVLNNGQVIGDGEPNEVVADPIVQEAYVGGEGANHAEI